MIISNSVVVVVVVVMFTAVDPPSTYALSFLIDTLGKWKVNNEMKA